MRTPKFYLLAAMVAIIIVVPVFVRSPFALRLLTRIAVFTVYASSWNLLAYSGQGSLGHATFLGIGGFVSSLIAINLGIPPIVGVFVGGLFAAGVCFFLRFGFVWLQ